MYIESITLENVRTFEKSTKLRFVHPDKDFLQNNESSSQAVPRPQLTNVNLLFGDNASGKTTLLESIALAALGPTITDSRISPRPCVRFPREGEDEKSLNNVPESESSWDARIKAELVLHGREEWKSDSSRRQSGGVSDIRIQSKGELERFMVPNENQDLYGINWNQAYESDNSSFFIVAYGATRRVEKKSEFGQGYSRQSQFARANRVESVITEGYPLIPLQTWFLEKRKGKRRQEIVSLINKLIEPSKFSFEGKEKKGHFLFSRGGMDVPFSSLSDAYRAFFGWTADLLYHLDFATKGSSSTKLRDVPGVVLVDEIDLHLHPRWQLEVIGTIARVFPRLQFIFTSHSPLIAGSVEWMNITHLRLNRFHRTVIDTFEHPVHGLDADQILLSSLFGLKSTRSGAKENRLKELTIRARQGDKEAAIQLMSEMTRGSETGRR